MGSAKQAGQQRHQGDADQGHAAARHQLLHALAFGTRVVVTVTFQQVDGTPDAKASSEGDNEGLENGNGFIEKIYIV